MSEDICEIVIKISCFCFNKFRGSNFIMETFIIPQKVYTNMRVASHRASELSSIYKFHSPLSNEMFSFDEYFKILMKLRNVCE